MWTNVDLDLAVQGVKKVDLDSWYDAENYKPRVTLIWSVEENE